MTVPEAYPFVAVRWIPAVYGRRDVRFVAHGRSDDATGDILIEDPEPYQDGTLTAGARKKLIDKVLADAAHTKFKMCCVFGPKDAVYCGVDGSTVTNATPPSGGLRFD